MQRYFGTDGIRGRAGEKLTPELAMRAAYGFTRTVRKGGKKYAPTGKPVVVVGCDSRLSSPMIKAAVLSGFNCGGCDVLDLGLVPTPVVPFIVLKHGAVGGVMITASHNPIEDNGVKFFGQDGYKINAQRERSIEETISSPGMVKVPGKVGFGSFTSHDPADEYLSFIGKINRSNSGTPKLKLLLDCAHGATCRMAPEVFNRAGYKVEAIHDSFDGYKVNVKCGATDLRELGEKVKDGGFNLGLAFDGDGDRVLAVDEAGRPVSGDKIIALMATRLKRYRDKGAVVMTHMTNIGVEKALNHRGVKMVRTEVGDINVLHAMIRRHLTLGGEQSGHIIMLDRLPGGDGILAGLQLANLVRSAKQPLGKLAGEFSEYPQVLTNLAIRDKHGWRDNRGFTGRLEKLIKKHKDVRFYLRPSGTEDVVRVLTEASCPELCRQTNEEACDLFRSWDKRYK